MAEIESEKVLTLAQQYSLPERKEQPVQVEVPVEETKEPFEESKDPIEETKGPVEEIKAPIEEPKDESPTASVSEEPAIAGEVTAEKIDETSAPEESTEATESEESVEEEVVEETPEIKFETAPADFRFPTTNQSRHCFTRYVEYHRCIAAKGDDAPECNKFAKYYRSLCPGEWVDKWNEQRENGTFPGPL